MNILCLIRTAKIRQPCLKFLVTEYTHSARYSVQSFELAPSPLSSKRCYGTPLWVQGGNTLARAEGGTRFRRRDRHPVLFFILSSLYVSNVNFQTLSYGTVPYVDHAVLESAKFLYLLILAIALFLDPDRIHKSMRIR